MFFLVSGLGFGFRGSRFEGSGLGVSESGFARVEHREFGPLWGSKKQMIRTAWCKHVLTGIWPRWRLQGLKFMVRGLGPLWGSKKSMV